MSGPREKGERKREGDESKQSERDEKERERWRERCVSFAYRALVMKELGKFECILRCLEFNSLDQYCKTVVLDLQ